MSGSNQPDEILSRIAAWAISNLAKQEDSVLIMAVGSIAIPERAVPASDVDLLHITYGAGSPGHKTYTYGDLEIDVAECPLQQAINGLITVRDPSIVPLVVKGVVIYDRYELGRALKRIALKAYNEGPLANKVVRDFAVGRCYSLLHRLTALKKRNDYDPQSLRMLCMMFLNDILHLSLTLKNEWDEGHRAIITMTRDKYPEIYRTFSKILSDRSVENIINTEIELISDVLSPFADEKKAHQTTIRL